MSDEKENGEDIVQTIDLTAWERSRMLALAKSAAKGTSRQGEIWERWEALVGKLGEPGFLKKLHYGGRRDESA